MLWVFYEKFSQDISYSNIIVNSYSSSPVELYSICYFHYNFGTTILLQIYLCKGP